MEVAEDGKHLSEMEMWILSEQLRQLGATVKQLDERPHKTTLEARREAL